MTSISIKTLDRLTHEDLTRLVDGYVSDSVYRVKKTDDGNRIAIHLRRTRIRPPYTKVFPHPAGELRKYRGVMNQGWSLGAYDGTELVGLALAEPRHWNRSVWVWEIGVAPSHRRRGIGRRLIAGLARRARKAGLRVLVCETQTTNVPAIDFYRKVGFVMEGVDFSYYSNEDLEKGEVAIFMKLRVPASRPSGRSGTGARRRTSE